MLGYGKSPLVLLLALVAQAATVDQRCIDACSDYSGALNFCRDSFDWKPGHTDAGLATEYIKCICEGSRGDGNLGASRMGESINTCVGCSITPGVIKNNLNTLNQLCSGIAVGGVEDEDVLAFSPFGYSVLTWNADGQPNAQGPS